MTAHPSACWLALTIALALPISLQASPIEYQIADAQATQDTTGSDDTVGNGLGDSLNSVLFAGDFENAGGTRAIQRVAITFQLDALGEGDMVTSARLRVRLHNLINDPPGPLSVYHLPEIDTTTVTPDFYHADATLVTDALIEPDTLTNTWHEVDVTQLIRALYEGQADATPIVAFRAQIDGIEQVELANETSDRYSLGNRSWGPSDYRMPRLIVETALVPEPASLALMSLGAIMCLNRRRRP